MADEKGTERSRRFTPKVKTGCFTCRYVIACINSPEAALLTSCTCKKTPTHKMPPAASSVSKMRRLGPGMHVSGDCCSIAGAVHAGSGSVGDPALGLDLSRHSASKQRGVGPLWRVLQPHRQGSQRVVQPAVLARRSASCCDGLSSPVARWNRHGCD